MFTFQEEIFPIFVRYLTLYKTLAIPKIVYKITQIQKITPIPFSLPNQPKCIDVQKPVRVSRAKC